MSGQASSAIAKVDAPSKQRGSKPGERRGGRQKGTPNKVTALLKDNILKALDEAHPDGAIAYLKQQATANPTAFLTLVGKVLPLQINGAGDDGEHVHKIILEAVSPK